MGCGGDLGVSVDAKEEKGDVGCVAGCALSELAGGGSNSVVYFHLVFMEAPFDAVHR